MCATQGTMPSPHQPVTKVFPPNAIYGIPIHLYFLCICGNCLWRIKKSPGCRPGLRYNLIKPKLTLAGCRHICIALYFFEQQNVAATIFFAFVHLHRFYHVPFGKLGLISITDDIALRISV